MLGRKEAILCSEVEVPYAAKDQDSPDDDISDKLTMAKWHARSGRRLAPLTLPSPAQIHRIESRQMERI